MRAAAELARVAGHLDDADDFAVLLPEEHHRPEIPRLLERSLEDAHGQILEDLLVHALLDVGTLLVRQRPRMREVEAELVGAYGRARLAHVVAEHVLQR